MCIRVKATVYNIVISVGLLSTRDGSGGEGLPFLLATPPASTPTWTTTATVPLGRGGRVVITLPITLVIAVIVVAFFGILLVARGFLSRLIVIATTLPKRILVRVTETFILVG